MKIAKLTILPLALILLTSCNKKVFYAEDHHVDEKGWNINEKLEYDIVSPDATTYYNFLIDIRNTTKYPYDRTFLFINTTFPDGSIAHDTLECPLADVTGQWYGKQSGHYINNRYYFRKNVRFPQKGHYHFEILHGMRDTNIIGIKNVGFRIEHIK